MKKLVKIRITLPDKNTGRKGRIITVTKQVGLDESLRQVILTILKDYHNLLPTYLSIDNIKFIAIYLHSYEDNFKKYGNFGIPYTVNEDKSIRILALTESLHRKWTLRELEELVSVGVLTGSADDLDIYLPMGLGAGGIACFDWLGFAADTIAVVSFARLLPGCIKKIIYRKRYKDIRVIVDKWIKNSNIKEACQIRELIDTKSGWELKTLKTILGIRYDADMIRILEALGYEPYANEWRLGGSAKSKRRRRKWESNEKKFARSRKSNM